MFQFNLSVDEANASWFWDMEKVLTHKIKAFGAVAAVKEESKRLNISVACENEFKNEVVFCIKDCVAEVFLSVVKLQYLKKTLVLPHLKKEAYRILLHTLVAFDRDLEKELILQNLKISDHIALDGLMNFKLTELKKRWNDIAELAANNSAYLNNDETLNELLKFLMSSISPKVNKLEVTKNPSDYGVSGKFNEKDFEYKLVSPEQLLLYLINAAPLELVLKGDFEDDILFKRLVCIFDAKEPGAASIQN